MSVLIILAMVININEDPRWRQRLRLSKTLIIASWLRCRSISASSAPIPKRSGSKEKPAGTNGCNLDQQAWSPRSEKPTRFKRGLRSFCAS